MDLGITVMYKIKVLVIAATMMVIVNHLAWVERVEWLRSIQQWTF